MTLNNFDLTGAFLDKQATMLNSFSAIRFATAHPGTLGDESEADWLALLREFLPARYRVGPIFAIDSRGKSSHQIDVAVYDQQYSPLWFGTKGDVRFVPVESVYAVFETKPTLTLAYIRYAEEKIASVRSLKRTSAAVKHAGGTFAAADPSQKHIIGGILTTNSSWTTHSGTQTKLNDYLLPLGQPGSLDIGIALNTVTFDSTPIPRPGGGEQETERLFSEEGHQLIYFAIRLFRQLQLLGTVLALDMGEYERALVTKKGPALPAD